MINETEKATIAQKKNKLIEISLFIVFNFFSLYLLEDLFCLGSCPFSLLAFIIIVHNLILFFIIFWILKFRQETFQKIGWTKENLGKHLLFGVILFPPFYFSVSIMLYFFTSLGLSHLEKIPSFLVPQNGLQIVEGVFMILTVAVVEEIIFRGYLLSRLIEITESIPGGVLISTFIFALGHVYEGTAGVLTVTYIGIVYSLIFLREKSLTINIVLHFFTDLIPIVLLPLGNLSGFNLF
jgi:membrane protease YdiL (CAAX protease family)